MVSLIIHNTSALQNQLKGVLADKRPSINNTHFSRLLPKQLFGLINKRRGMFIQRSIPDISKIASYHYSGKLDDEAVIPPFCTNEGYLAFTTDRAISSRSLKLRLCILTGSGKKFHKNIVLYPLDDLWKA